ncbi:MAG: Uma2 family endonuclease [Acidobacteria bacterium]|nr:Uma2 family endonuclease [Acidobacteriota bacterium]
MKPATTKMTYDQYCLLPEDGNQYEVFDGELVMTPSPSSRHQKIVQKLLYRLSAYLEAHSLGEVFVAPLDTIFDQYTVLQPDILFVSRERVAEVVKERIEGAPDLVVEVLSPSTFYKDLRRKMAVYSQFGVREYWIVDPEKQTIELYQQGGEGLQLARQFASQETFQSPLFQGFQLPVSSIF